MRLGATNPTCFNLEFFVNDLSKPGAATFESLGTLPYNQHQQIHLKTAHSIPTDGLVLRGMYNTITLAVYGSLCKSTAEQLAQQGEAAAATKEEDKVTHKVADTSQQKQQDTQVQRSTVPVPAVQNRSDVEEKDRVRRGDYQSHHWPDLAASTNGREDEDCSSARSRSRSHDRSRSPPSDLGRGRHSPAVGLGPHYTRPGSRTPSERNSSASRHSPVPRDPASVPREADGSEVQQEQQQQQQQQLNPNSQNDDLFEEMSDISDGELSDKEELKPPTKNEKDECPSSSADASQNFADERMSSSVRAEDVEEISDEEATWSDNDMDIDMNFEFGEDWEEPVKIFDFESVDVMDEPAPRLSENLAGELRTKLHEVPSVGTVAWIAFVEDMAELLQDQKMSSEQWSAFKNSLLPVLGDCLDLDLALKHEAPTDKVRHIKSGLKLVRNCLSCSRDTSADQSLVDQMQKTLMGFISDKSLSYSLKLLALEAFDESLRTSFLCRFQHEDSVDQWIYRKGKLVRELANVYGQSATRVKQAIKAILSRMNFYELTHSFRTKVVAFVKSEPRGSPQDIAEEIVTTGQSIVSILVSRLNEVSQPKKVLPVRFTFRNDRRELYQTPYAFFTDVFASCDLLECLYALLSKDGVPSSLFRCACDMLEAVSDLPGGPKYLCKRARTTNSLVRFLIALCNARDASNEQHLNALVIKVSVAIHGSQALRSLAQQPCATGEDVTTVEALQKLYGMTFCSAGRAALAGVIDSENYVPLLINMVVLETSDEEESNDINFTREAIRGYAMELLLITIKMTSNPDSFARNRELLNDLVTKTNETDHSKSVEIEQWVKPLEGLGDLQKLCEGVKKSVDSVFPMPAYLVMTTRLINLECNSSDSLFQHQQQAALIDLHSHGLGEHYASILSKISEAHQHPNLHPATFSGEEGFLLFSALLPIVETLRELVAFAVASRTDEYKDTSLVRHMVKIYSLASAIPASASVTHDLATRTNRCIVRILANMTVPTFDAASEKVEQSCWTMMLSDVLDSIITGTPDSYTSIISILNKLLPLPLPMAVNVNATNMEISTDMRTNKLRDARKLWSAHLVPTHKKVRTVIRQVMGLSDGELTGLLLDFCHRVADLSSPTALMVAEECIGALCDEMESLGAESSGSKPAYISLPLVAKLASFPSIRSAIIDLLDKDSAGDFLEKCCKAVEEQGATQAKEMVLSIFKSLFTASANDPRIPNSKVSATIVASVIRILLKDARMVSVILPSLVFLHAVTTHQVGRAYFLDTVKAFSNVISSVSEAVLGLSDQEQFQRGCLLVVDTVSNLRPCFVNVSEEQSGGLETLGRFLEAPNKDIPHPLTLIKHRLESRDQLATTVQKIVEIIGDLSDNSGASSDEWTKSSILAASKESQETPRNTVTFTSELSVCLDQSEKVILPEPEPMKVDLVEITEHYLKEDSHLQAAVREACSESVLFKRDGGGGGKMKGSGENSASPRKKSILERKALQNRSIISSFKAGGSVFSRLRGFNRQGGVRPDGFRSRPPNTSRPPSLHVDDFLLLQSRGQQPTGPTGYNKQSVKAAKELFAQREAQHQAKGGSSIVGFREATKEPVFDDDMGGGRPMGIVGRRGGGIGGRNDKGPRGGFRGGGGRGGGAGGSGAGPGAGSGDRVWSPMHVGDLERRKFFPSGVGAGPGGMMPMGMKDRRKIGGPSGGGGGGPLGGRDDGRPRHSRNMNR